MAETTHGRRAKRIYSTQDVTSGDPGTMPAAPEATSRAARLGRRELVSRATRAPVIATCLHVGVPSDALSALAGPRPGARMDVQTLIRMEQMPMPLKAPRWGLVSVHGVQRDRRVTVK